MSLRGFAVLQRTRRAKRRKATPSYVTDRTSSVRACETSMKTRDRTSVNPTCLYRLINSRKQNPRSKDIFHCSIFMSMINKRCITIIHSVMLTKKI